MDGKSGLQLLPGTKKRLGIKVPGENRFLYIGSAILGAVVATSFWLSFNTTKLENDIKSVDEQILALDQKRNKPTELKIKMTQRQLNLTAGLINEHTYFSQAILKIASLVKEEVQIESLSVDVNGKVDFSGFAKGYTAVARQVAIFLADDSVIDFELGKLDSQSDGKIKFGMTVNFDKISLLQKKK